MFELELHLRFFREQNVRTVFELDRLAQLLPYQHIWFARISRRKLIRALRRRGFTVTAIDQILAGVSARRQNLSVALRFLTVNAHVQNRRRLLTPLRKENRAVFDALEEWAARWRKACRHPATPNDRV
jgi:hypothetical protein